MLAKYGIKSPEYQKAREEWERTHDTSHNIPKKIIEKFPTIAELYNMRSKDMNNMVIYSNNEFGNVRTIQQDNEIWFVAKDVCDCLELSNPTMVLSRLEEDERAKFNLGRQGDTNCVNEYGLYNLVLASRKPEAKRFKRWITHEVIPSIRQYGGYMVRQDEMDPEELMAKALSYANGVILKLKDEKSILQDKADYYDELVDRNHLTNIRTTAKLLQVGEKHMVKWLLDNGYLYRNPQRKLTPYADKKTDGMFEVKEYYDEYNNLTGTQTFVTTYGRNKLRKKMRVIGQA